MLSGFIFFFWFKELSFFGPSGVLWFFWFSALWSFQSSLCFFSGSMAL